ncbi:MAG TPA: DegT/DnrJ/EryC1/StrS family aminotransferase [Tepidisphaeraceae bacterium]|nr:DegT/DnrJ/EryC1/StrS family aminotransferase [Tepidisphaeraceae bacterium]
MEVKLLDLQGQYLPLRNEIRRALDEVCDAQALILGPHVEKFEKHLAEYCQTKHAIGVSSGTDALLCALMGLGIQPGDEVICPSFTFFATAGSIARLGAKPVFAEIDPTTFNLDPNQIEKKITPRTRAIMPVHLFGQLADMEAINGIACRHGLKVIEDAAQAIGAKRNGKPACSHGFAGCLSFYPTKNLGAFGDAGAICTNDDAFAETCRLLRVHGSGHQYHHKLIGGMFRLAAMQAAVLEVKLKYLDGWHEGRRRNAKIYDKLLAGSKVVTPKIEPENWSIYNQYVIRVPDRDKVKERLGKAGVGSAIYYPIPLHLQECFAYLGVKEGDLPESERACREVLALPVYPELREEQVRYVAQQLLEAVR